MRLFDIARGAALISLAGLLFGCPKKDTEAIPEPTSPGAAQAPANDKAGAEAPATAVPPAAPAAATKKNDDKGGW